MCMYAIQADKKERKKERKKETVCKLAWMSVSAWKQIQRLSGQETRRLAAEQCRDRFTYTFGMPARGFDFEAFHISTQSESI